MNQKQVGALLVLKELGITNKMETFDDRLCVQKSIYLAQAAGVALGHFFNWYLRGPYSPTLTQDVFEAIQNYDPDAALQGWGLDDATRTRLAGVKAALAPQGELPLPAWLELLASVHYLLDRGQAEGTDPEALRGQLERYKKFFTTDQISAGLRCLRGAGLLA